MALSKLNDRAREWALTCNASLDAAFPTGIRSKDKFLVLTPPNQIYRVRSCSLVSRQELKELSDYVQELGTLLADMQLVPLPKVVQVTIFTQRIRIEAARTKVFRVHSATFEEAMDVAFNTELNFKFARYGTQ